MNLLNFDYDKTALHKNSIFIVTIKTDSACTQCWYSRSTPGDCRQSSGSLGGVLLPK